MVCGAYSGKSMNVMAPTLVTVTSPPRKGVLNAPGAFVAAAWATVNCQNGLLVCITTAMPLVLLVAVYVRGSPDGEVAVTGKISDLPAAIVTLGIGSITGAAWLATAKETQASNPITQL